jgi:hypothetical protein
METVDLEPMLRGTAKVLNDLISRQMISVMEGVTPVPDMTPDDSLTVLNRLVDGFTTGRGLASVQADVDRLTTAQEDRMTLVTSLITQHSLVRMTRFMLARDKLERFMLSATDRGDLTPAEALIFLKMIQADMAEIQTNLKPVAIKDAKGLVDKADFAQKREGAVALTKYHNTTAQGREIMRKLLYAVSKPTSVTGGSTNTSRSGHNGGDHKAGDLE